jgi:hypothetical protein
LSDSWGGEANLRAIPTLTNADRDCAATQTGEWSCGSFAQLRITVWTGDARDTRTIEVVAENADSTIRLLESIEALFPMLAYIHVFLDNAAIITPS